MTKEEEMFIKKEDCKYFETLSKNLDEARRKKFLDILIKEGTKKTGEDISKVKVVGDEIFDVRGIDSKEFITRTMIKKAYKTAKEE